MPIYSPAGYARNVQPRSYIPEIEDVGDKGLEFHIANRSDDITKLLRKVAYSEKPNFAITGSPGIGKTLIVNYIVNVITGKINLPKDHEWRPLFEEIKSKAREFQTRDYLFLPNLQDPYRPVVLDFVNSEIKSASNQANAFCNDVIRLFENIGLEEKIFPHFEKSEFKNYLTLATKHIYEELYRKMNDVISEEPAGFNFRIINNFTGYGINYDFFSKISWGDIKLGLEMRNSVSRKCRDGKRRLYQRRITEQQIRKRLHNDLREKVKGKVTQMLSIVNDAYVPGLDLEQKRQVLLDVLEEVKHEYDSASKLYKKDKGLVPYYHALAKLKASALPDLKLSQESLDWCNKNLEQILDKYKTTKHSALLGWMESVARYFRENTETVSNEILGCYLTARGERVIKHDKKSINVTLSHPFADIENDEFALPHGGAESTFLRYVLAPKSILSSKSGEICVKFPTSFNKEDMWGKIGKSDKDDDDDDDSPPHRKFTPGYLMESSMVVLVDNMQGFFKALLGSEVQDAAARRQAILTFVEEGNLMIEDKGVTFIVHSPTMIVGCDNENPFVKFHGRFADEYEFDESMRSRFTVYELDDLAQNVPEARRETISMINTAVSDFNEKHKLNLHLSPEVIDQLLIEWSWPDLLNLDYRSLRARVVELLGFARMEGDNVCSLEHLIENEKENEPKWIHHFVDNKIYEMIKNPPEKAVGEVCGVHLYGLLGYHPRYMPGEVSTIRSAVIVDTPSNAGKNFQQYNIDAKLTDETAIKGFNEAVDFVKRQIGSPVRFISKTTFHRDFEVAGDSASLAHAVAICSALGETPIYSSTVYTGNLSFFDGTVGPIGGVYNKARTVWRANQMLNKDKNKRMRFVFPVENYRELTEMLKTSSYPIANDIDLIPANTFAEAFYLGATNTKINTETLPQKANTLWGKTLERIKANVKRWNNEVLAAYGKKLIK